MLLDHEKDLERRQYDEYEDSEEEVFGLDDGEDDEKDEDDMGDLDDDLGGAKDEDDELDLDSKSACSCGCDMLCDQKPLILTPFV